MTFKTATLLGIIVLSWTALFYTLVTFCNIEFAKDKEIKGLETLVEYHQLQTFELLQELHEVKRMVEGE